MILKELPPFHDEIAFVDSRFYAVNDKRRVASRTRNLYAQCFLAFAVATITAAILVPAYPNADRMFHPFFLLTQIRGWLVSASAWHALGRQIVRWSFVLLTIAAVMTLTMGIVCQPRPDSQEPAPEKERI